jgi:hypothetical protein
MFLQAIAYGTTGAERLKNGENNRKKRRAVKEI